MIFMLFENQYVISC